MDKRRLMDSIIEILESDLEKATKSAIESAESATHDESKSEGKYDTRGLETSYLAAGQARHAIELREALAALRAFTPPESGSPGPIALGSLVETLSDQGRERFFVAPAIGGIEVSGDSGLTVMAISPKSPLGQQLIGKDVGARIPVSGGKTVIRVY